MEINIKTKFEVGQEVQIIKEISSRRDIKENCPICEGAGHFVHNGHDIYCSECNGRGHVVVGHKYNVQYILGEFGKITTIKIQTNTSDCVRVLYKISGKFVPEYMICSSKEEAIRLCAAYNCGADYLWHSVCEQPRFDTDIIAVDKEGSEHNVFQSGLGIIKWRYAIGENDGYTWHGVEDTPEDDKAVIIIGSNGNESPFIHRHIEGRGWEYMSNDNGIWFHVAKDCIKRWRYIFDDNNTVTSKKTYTWYDVEHRPEVDRDIIVMDKNGKEYDRHRWIGHAYYRFTENNHGEFDGIYV